MDSEEPPAGNNKRRVKSQKRREKARAKENRRLKQQDKRHRSSDIHKHLAGTEEEASTRVQYSAHEVEQERLKQQAKRTHRRVAKAMEEAGTEGDQIDWANRAKLPAAQPEALATGLAFVIDGGR